MIPQDILNVLSEPQGWSIIVGCILVLLLALVYRRLGKLATNTKRNFSELREAMDFLGARLDAAGQLADVQPPPVPDEVAATDDLALGSEASVHDAMVAPASVTADLDAGLNESEVDAASEPEEPLATDLADAQPEPASDSFGFAVPESPDDEVETIGEGVQPKTLNEPGEVVGVGQAEGDDESFSFEMPVPDDVAQAEDDGFPMEEVENRLVEESQDALDSSEDTGDFLFGGEDAVTEPVAEAVEQEEETVLPVMEEQDESEQSAGLETEAGVDAFQFSSPDAAAETEDALSNAADDQDFEATAMGEQSQNSFSGAATDEPENAEAQQIGESAEPSAAVQPPSVGPIEASPEVPPEPVDDAANQPSPPPSIPVLEPLPGNPDKPNVGVARCRECGRKIAYPKRLSGKRMRCPACQSAAVLP